MDGHLSNNADSGREEKLLGPADALRFFGKEELKTTVILLYAALAIILWKYIPSLPLPSATTAGVGQIEISSYTRAVGRGAEILAAGKPRWAVMTAWVLSPPTGSEVQSMCPMAICRTDSSTP